MIQPATQQERFESLDVLRGIAVLGILLMNIQSFSMVHSAYGNPTTYGDFSGLNLAVWISGRLFADQKFITIFSILFGAGIALVGERISAAGGKPFWAHHRRMAVLLMIGLFHAYFIWHGDILTTYALYGVVVYWFRRCSPAFLFIVGMIGLILPPIGMVAVDTYMPQLWPDTWESLRGGWAPGPESSAWELKAYRGGYWEQMQFRASEASYSQWMTLLWFGWRIAGLMLIGMALLKCGVLTGARSPRFYRVLLGVGLPLGLSFETGSILLMFRSGWELEVLFTAMQLDYWGSLLVAAAWIAVVMLVCQMGAWPVFRDRMASVGRLAFSNYIGQSLVCTTVFYGHGLGLFGHLERWHQLLLVIGIWWIQITGSVWWLNHFRYGPLEWLWRCATYLRWVPNWKQEKPEPPVIVAI